MADSLATLSSMYEVNSHDKAQIIRIVCRDELACYETVEEGPDNNPRFYNIKCYLQKQEYPTDASIENKKTLRRSASNFFLNGDVLDQCIFMHILSLLYCKNSRVSFVTSTILAYFLNLVYCYIYFNFIWYFLNK